MQPTDSVTSTETPFAFGSNWRHYLSSLNDTRITAAEESLKSMLEVDSLAGTSFLDVGCGSGLFSLAARRLGATVRSFDVDVESVACTCELKERYYPNFNSWTVERGSILSDQYLLQLVKHDIVYSWGVLHHTGHMWQALENIIGLVCTGGKLVISIYNDQGRASKRWRSVKRLYNRSALPVRVSLLLGVLAYAEVNAFRSRAVGLRNPFPFKYWSEYHRNRGMSRWHDLVDWVGGYPFEVAKPEEIFDFCRARGLVLVKLKTCGGSLGCNEFVFQRAG